MRWSTILKPFFSRPTTLGGRSVRAGAWNTAELVLTLSLRLAGNLVMTRLLLPEAFGLMAMVTTLLTGLALVTDLGINRSVVQSREGENLHFLRVCWVVQSMRGAVMASLVLAAAGLLALLAPVLAPPGTVYADPRLPGLVALASLSLLMKGAESPNQFLAERHMKMGRVALVNLTSQIVGLVSMITLGLLNPTVWALITGMLLGDVCRLALTHLAFVGPRMAVEWDRRISAELWDFGKWLMGASALTFLARHADRLILGALLDIESFSFYTIALMWVQATAELVNRLTGKVGFSVFAEVRRERPTQRALLFRRFTTAIDAICLSIFLVMLFGGSFLIDLLYSHHYATSATFIPLLALGILVSRFQALGMLILSEGDSPAMLLTSAIRAAAICLCLPLGFSLFGITGALLATALSPLAAAPFLIARTHPVLGRRIWVDVVWVAAILTIAVLIGIFMAPAKL